MTHLQSEAAFKTFDVNGNKVIDKYEYILCRSSTTGYIHSRDNNQVYSEMRLSMIFRMYDIDGNGTLDKDEFKCLLRAMAAGDGHIEKLLAGMKYLYNYIAPYLSKLTRYLIIPRYAV